MNSGSNLEHVSSVEFLCWSPFDMVGSEGIESLHGLSQCGGATIGTGVRGPRRAHWGRPHLLPPALTVFGAEKGLLYPLAHEAAKRELQIFWREECVGPLRKFSFMEVLNSHCMQVHGVANSPGIQAKLHCLLSTFQVLANECCSLREVSIVVSLSLAVRVLIDGFCVMGVIHTIPNSVGCVGGTILTVQEKPRGALVWYKH
eukprot:1081451-Amphidinium_carterae.1